MSDERDIPALDPCCVKEADASLTKHRDVAVCGGCQRLLLAWDNPDEQRKTRAELESYEVPFAEGRKGSLFVTSKVRTG